MSFKTLEQRFLDNAEHIYTRFGNADVLVSILPDSAKSKEKIRDDIRLAPFGFSLSRDKLRIRRLDESQKGDKFKRDQLVLQTFNTFAETRAYNPANLLINTTPGLKFSRHIGLSVLGPKTNSGALQKATVDSFSSSGFIAGIVKNLITTTISPLTALTARPKKVDLEGKVSEAGIFYLRPEDVINPRRLPANQALSDRGRKKQTIIYKSSNDIVAFSKFSLPLGAKDGTFPLQYLNRKSISFPISVTPYIEYIEKFNTLKNEASKFSILKSTNPDGSITEGTALVVGTYSADDFTIVTPPKEGTVHPTFGTKIASWLAQQYPRTIEGVDNKKNYGFRELETSNNFNGYFLGNSTRVPASGGRPQSTLSTFTGLQDQLNFDYLGVEGKTSVPSSGEVDYSTIITPDSSSPQDNKKSKDIIKFEFRSVDGKNPVQFRAFISSLKETVKPEFNEQKYLGRIERYVTYSGAKRTVSMTFDVVALGQTEIRNVWKRINYLAGLAFPTGVTTSGFIKPPLFKITIGGIYDMQPAYIENLNFDFIDESTVFDIDANESRGGVPQYIKVDLSLVLMEKKTRLYDSPFYKIVEDTPTAKLTPPTTPQYTPATVGDTSITDTRTVTPTTTTSDTPFQFDTAALIRDIEAFSATFTNPEVVADSNARANRTTGASSRGGTNRRGQGGRGATPNSSRSGGSGGSPSSTSRTNTPASNTAGGTTSPSTTSTPSTSAPASPTPARAPSTSAPATPPPSTETVSSVGVAYPTGEPMSRFLNTQTIQRDLAPPLVNGGPLRVRFDVGPTTYGDLNAREREIYNSLVRQYNQYVRESGQVTADQILGFQLTQLQRRIALAETRALGLPSSLIYLQGRVR